MSFCDELEANIRESKTQAETLLQVALLLCCPIQNPRWARLSNGLKSRRVIFGAGRRVNFGRKTRL